MADLKLQALEVALKLMVSWNSYWKLFSMFGQSKAYFFVCTRQTRSEQLHLLLGLCQKEVQRK